MMSTQAASTEGRARDHLFVSYATEDDAFAEWLSLKLTSAGYRVWCDRIKLLGGESYPRDIDNALRDGTFRLLAVLSHASVKKANPLKERTLALNLAKERKLDFIIPLRIDDIAPTEVGWMMSDLTFIDFAINWAEGFAKLLKKLESVDAPRPLADGRSIVAQWASENVSPVARQERLWTNSLEVRELPVDLLRLSGQPDYILPLLKDWPHQRDGADSVWVFEIPATIDRDRYRLRRVPWRGPPFEGRVRLDNVATDLLRQYVEAHCLAKGLIRAAPDRPLYFPPALVRDNRLQFMGYSGRGTWVKCVGDRRFHVAGGATEVTRHHLGARLKVRCKAWEAPQVEVRLHIVLTDDAGTHLESGKALRRRRKICKQWWNHEWLSRLLGVVSWIADGRAEFNLARTPDCRIVIAGRPSTVGVPVGIDEATLEKLDDVDETEISDDVVDALVETSGDESEEEP